MIIRLYIRVKNAGLTGGKNGRVQVLNIMRPNLQVLMTVEQNLYSVIHPVIRKVLKVIISKAPIGLYCGYLLPKRTTRNFSHKKS